MPCSGGRRIERERHRTPSLAAHRPTLRRAGQCPHLAGSLCPPPRPAEEPTPMPTPPVALPLIPRANLFRQPDARARLDRTRRPLAVVARPARTAVLNIWVAPVDDIGAARVITDDKQARHPLLRLGLHAAGTCSTCRTRAAPRTWHIYAVPIDGGPVRDLTPFAGVNARIAAAEPRSTPEAWRSAINDRDKAWHDLYRIDIRTGERELLLENPHELGAIVARSAAHAPARHQDARRRGRQHRLSHRWRAISSRCSSSSTRTI